jgi:hypothetical protein
MWAILDESLTLAELLKAGAKGPAGDIAFTGAALDCALILNSQLGDKNALGDLRDLIPQAISFGTKTWQQTDTILGPGATQNGAECHDPNLPAGVGWSGAEDVARPQKFRAANVSKHESKLLAEGKREDGGKKLEHRVPHYTYRFRNANHQLLYIGETNNIERRFKEHAKDKPWWPEVHMPLTVVQEWDSRAEGIAEQDKQIESDWPLYNDKMNRKNPLRVEVPAPKNQPALDDGDEPDAVPPAGTWPLLDPSPTPPPPVSKRRTERKPKTPPVTGPTYFWWDKKDQAEAVKERAGATNGARPWWDKP